MKKYTSPAVTNSDSVSLSNVLSPIIKAAMRQAFMVDTMIGMMPSISTSKLLGEDFTGLQVDPLMPCLEV